MEADRASGGGVRTELERQGLAVTRLEEEGRFRFTSEPDSRAGRVEEIWRLLYEEAKGGRSLWVSFNWAEQIDLDTAVMQQRDLRKLIEEGQSVVKSAVLEEVAVEWPGKMLRRAQLAHPGTIWLSKAGLALSCLTPPPST